MPPSPIAARSELEMAPELVSVVPSKCPSKDLLDLANELEGSLLDWLRDPECHPAVVGFGFGVRWSLGQPTATPALHVYVSRAITADEAMPETLFPREFRGLALLQKVRPDWRSIHVKPADSRVDLSESGEMVAFAESPESVKLRQRQRPAVGGASIGHPGISGGTLGIRVRDPGAPKRALILSNCHVLARNPLKPVRGDPTIQPASADLGSEHGDVIGRLAGFCKLVRGSEPPNRMDAAVSELLDPTLVDEGLAGIGKIPSWRAASDLPIGTRVAKAGRTSGLTFGILKALGVTYKVDYGLDAPLFFSMQMLTSHLAGGGDSGSVLVSIDPEPSVVGLVLGGSRDVTLATPIEVIHDQLSIESAPAMWTPSKPTA